MVRKSTEVSRVTLPLHWAHLSSPNLWLRGFVYHAQQRGIADTIKPRVLSWSTILGFSTDSNILRGVLLNQKAMRVSHKIWERLNERMFLEIRIGNEMDYSSRTSRRNFAQWNLFWISDFLNSKITEAWKLPRGWSFVKAVVRNLYRLLGAFTVSINELTF